MVIKAICTGLTQQLASVKLVKKPLIPFLAIGIDAIVAEKTPFEIPRQHGYLGHGAQKGIQVGGAAFLDTGKYKIRFHSIPGEV